MKTKFKVLLAPINNEELLFNYISSIQRELNLRYMNYLIHGVIPIFPN